MRKRNAAAIERATQILQRTKQRLFAFRRAEAGSSLIEVALCLSLLLSLCFMVMAASEAAYARHYVAAAARQGTRYAIVRGSTFAGTACNGAGYACQATAADVQTYVRAHAQPGIAPANLVITATWPGLAASGLNCLSLNGANSPGCDVQVTARYTFTYKLPFLSSSSLGMQSTSTMVIVQ